MSKAIVDGINLFFMYYIFIYAIIFFISTIYSMIDIEDRRLGKRYQRIVNTRNNVNYIPVSVLIPAFNEEKTIVDSVKSILKSNYEIFEIIVISDGSTDYTAENTISAFNLKQILRPIRKVVKAREIVSIHHGEHREGNKVVKITLVCKEGGGKADALNMGVNIAKYPIVVSIDADSFLEEDAITNIVRPFIEDENTVAVGGNIKVANHVILNEGVLTSIKTPKKFLVIMQMIEYYRVFLTTRVWFNSFNGNLIISGAFGAFRKQSIINVGGYNRDTIGEDMELVVKIHSFYRKNREKYKIEYVPDAICWSQVPKSLRDLKSQRKRWHMGLIESIWGHKYIFLNFNYGLVGIFSFLYFLVYEMLSCIIELVGYAFIVIAFSFGFINIKFFIVFLSLYFVYGIVVSLAAIILENYMFRGRVTFKMGIKLLFYSIIEQFGYRQLSSWYRLLGVINYNTKGNRWKKINRESFT